MLGKHQSGSPHLRRRRGFTLVELLTVIAIISLLLALLMPGLKEARERAKNLKCVNNVRYLAQANIIYANEYDGQFVPFMVGYSQTISPRATVDPALPQWVDRNAWTSNSVTGYDPFLKYTTTFSDGTTPQSFFPRLCNSSNYQPLYIKDPKSFYCTSMDPTYSWNPAYPRDWTIFSSGVRSGYHYNFITSIGTQSGATVYRNYRLNDSVNMSTTAIIWDIGLKNGTYYSNNHLRKYNNGTFYAGGQSMAYLDGHAEWNDWRDKAWKDGS